MGSPIQCALKGSDNICVDDNLLVSFKRTLRLSNDHQETFSPPDLGTIPLKNAATYMTKLPDGTEPKSGLLLPMHQSDATWIHFALKTQKSYLVKVYINGINAISGEPATEDESTRLRRQAQHAHDPSSLQDYIVVPEQLFLDGASDADGNVQQFALPLATAGSTGKDAVRTIQLEVTPYDQSPPKPAENDDYSILVRTYMPRTFEIKTNPHDTVEYFKRRLEKIDGLPVHQQRLLYKSSETKFLMLEDARKLSDYEIPKDATVYLIYRGHGTHELRIAADGKRKQLVNTDPKGDEWLPERTAVFNVHMVGPAVYRAITGARPPFEPIGRETYEKHGVRFLPEYERVDDGGAGGDLAKAGSGNGDGEEKAGAGNEEFINPNGPLREFRTLRDLKKEYGG